MQKESNKLIYAFTAIISQYIVIFLFLPLTVYTLNPNDVMVELSTILQGGLLYGGIVSFALLLLCLIPQLRRVLIPIVQISSIVAFILIVFPNRTGEITGFEPTTTASQWLPYVKLFGLIIIGLVISWKWPKHLRSSVIFALALGTVMTIYMFQHNYTRAYKPSLDLATALGSEKNIVIIVPDGFTGYRMVEVFSEMPELKQGFTGFTLYPRAIASAVNTPAGIGAMLTGGLDIALNIDDILERNSQNLSSSFLMDAVRNGYKSVFVSKLKAKSMDIPLYSEKDFIMSHNKRETDTEREYIYFLSVSLARILPQYFCNIIEKYMVTKATEQQDILNSEYETYHNIPLPHRDKFGSKLSMEYFIKNLHIGTHPKKALFLHINISHPPYVFDEEGKYSPGSSNATSIYTTKTLSRFFEKMKQIGAYDNSLIMVVSDHGGMWLSDVTMGGLYNGKGSVQTIFNPLLMVKRPNDGFPLKQNEMTVWLGDVCETARDFLGMGQSVKMDKPVVSLMHPEDNYERELNVPIFFRPDQASYHARLSDWTRINMKGVFENYIKIASDSKEVRFQPGIEITLSAGIDRLLSDSVKHGWVLGDEKQYEAIIEVNHIVTAKLSTQGILVIVEHNGKIEKYVYYNNIDKGVRHIKVIHSDDPFLAVGLKVPVAAIKKHFPDAKIKDIEKYKQMNFVCASNLRSDGKPMFDIGPGDVNIAFKIE